MQFTDEQIINCALVSLKHLRVMYTYFTEEAGTPELFTKADQLFNEITKMQRATYDLMIDEGFMTITPESSDKIQTAFDQLKNIVEEMN